MYFLKIKMSKYFNFCLFLLVHILFVFVHSSLISTSTGPLKGKIVCDDIVHTCYYSYEGIPYAEPPIGHLRFRPPVPKQPWTRILDATKPGCICPQIEMLPYNNKMSEDCLFINVFTPVRNITDLLPVVIFIHPGDFAYNSGNAKDLCGPQFFMKNYNILVTFNYRLGALGFLSFDHIDATGNAGVKDALLAIKWVNENIKRFGGDPSLITIMGEGSGAALVHALLLTDKSTGLFQAAILNGGSVTSTKYLQRDSKEVALQLCSELGLKKYDTSALIRELRKVDAMTIVQAQKTLYEKNTQIGFRLYIPFAITIEIETDSAIITRDPVELIKEGIKQNVPILTGFNDQAGLEIFPVVRQDPIGIVSRLNQNCELLVPSDILYSYGSTLRKDLGLAIKNFYFHNEDISIPTTQQYIDLVGDTSYIFSIDSWIKLHTSRAGSSPVYYYVFNYDAELNFYKIANNITYPGTAPGDELGYLFVTQTTRARLAKISSTTQNYINTRLAIINNFLVYRNPSPAQYSDTFAWHAAGQNRGFRNGPNNCKFVPCPPFPRRMNFWYRVYEQYCVYQKLNNTDYY